jgi:peroxiredoxin
MIRVGDTAPDFAAKACDGRMLRLSELRGAPLILFFFPKAFTRG